jgi:hypothetical protein
VSQEMHGRLACHVWAIGRRNGAEETSRLEIKAGEATATNMQRASSFQNTAFRTLGFELVVQAVQVCCWGFMFGCVGCCWGCSPPDSGWEKGSLCT